MAKQTLLAAKTRLKKTVNLYHNKETHGKANTSHGKTKRTPATTTKLNSTLGK